MKRHYLLYFSLLSFTTVLKAQNTFPASGTVNIGWEAASTFSLDVKGISRYQKVANFGETYDGMQYGKGIQISRAASQPDNAFHLSFIRAGQSVVGMGFLQNSSTFGIQAGGNNSLSTGIFLTAAGNVGIGLSAPTQKLEVSGSMQVNGNSRVNGQVLSVVAHPEIGGSISLGNPSKTAAGTASSWNIYNMTGSYGNSLQFWAYDNVGCSGGLCASRFTIMDNGNVGIGTSNPGSYKLAVEGIIGARKIKITQQSTWADFVFHPDYKLPSLYEVEAYIKDHQHLPEIPSAEEVEKEGVDVGEMNKKLLQKIEELTLYLIEQQKQNEIQDKRIAELEHLLTKETR